MSGDGASEFRPPIVEAEGPQATTKAANGLLDTSLRDVKDRISAKLKDYSSILGAHVMATGGVIMGMGMESGNLGSMALGFATGMAGSLLTSRKSRK